MIDKHPLDNVPLAPPEIPESFIANDPAALQEKLLSLQGLNAALAAENSRLKHENGHLSQEKEDLLSEVMRLAPYEDAHDDAETSLAIADAENKMNADQVERLRIDGKTGLLTPLVWEEETLQQMRLHRRETDTGDCYVMLADLDRFKQVNDTFGHLFGDKVLQATGDAGKETLGVEGTQKDRRRIKPLAGRFGGEEFVFWLPDMNLQEAELFAKRFQAAVNDIPFPNKSSAGNAVNDLYGRTTQGISIGIAEVNINPGNLEQSLKDALQHADEALYAVKEAGRNGTQVFQPDTTASI